LHYIGRSQLDHRGFGGEGLGLGRRPSLFDPLHFEAHDFARQEGGREHQRGICTSRFI